MFAKLNDCFIQSHALGLMNGYSIGDTKRKLTTEKEKIYGDLVVARAARVAASGDAGLFFRTNGSTEKIGITNFFI